MHHARTLLTFLVLVVVAACAGPTTPPPPPDPTVNAVAPNVAARGETITITGTDFGTTGTLTIGGTEATITTWNDTQIDATIAPGTPDGWQDVTVTTTDGTDDFTPFFVGTEFDGTATELQAFLDGLAKGTAVLLQAETYDLSADATPLIVDNHGLYGRGETQTTLMTSASDGMLTLVDFGQRVTLADMSIETDAFQYFHGDAEDVFATAGATSLPNAATHLELTKRTFSLPAPSSLETMAGGAHDLAASDAGPFARGALQPYVASSLLDTPTYTLWTFADAPMLMPAPAALETPELTLRDVTILDVAGLGAIGMPPSAMPNVALNLENVTVDAPLSPVSFMTTADLRLGGTTVTGEVVYLFALLGSLDILSGSDVTAATTVLLAAEAGLSVTGSSVEASEGDVQVVGAALAFLGGGALDTGGPIAIVDSTVQALDADLADATDHGQLAVVTQFAPILLESNPLVRAHDTLTIVTQQSTIGDADITLDGNVAVRAGVFKSEDAVHFRPEGMLIYTLGGPGVPDRVTLTGNAQIAATASIAAVAGSSNPGNLVVSGNQIDVGDGADDGMVLFGSGTDGSMDIHDNAVSSDDAIAFLVPDLAGATASLSGNTFTAEGDASPIIQFQAAGGSCDLVDNTFAANDVGADNPTTMMLLCPGVNPLQDAFTLDANVMSATGSGGSGIGIGGGTGGLDVTGNQVTSESTFMLGGNGAAGTVSGNTIALQEGPFLVVGDAASDLTMSGNVVTYENAGSFAIGFSNVGTVALTGNTFTDTGTPAAGTLSMLVGVSTTAVTIEASENTFTNFDRALHFIDVAAGALGIDATIQNNVFDFAIDAAPKVAELENVKDVIDARFNQWGANTDLVTVQGYVTKSGDTNVQGGDIDLDPITVP